MVTALEHAERYCRALCNGAEFGHREDEIVAVLRDLGASWSRDLEKTPPWSTVTDDCSPLELSVVFEKAALQLRLTTEAQATPASPSAYWKAGQQLNELLAQRYHADLAQFRRIEDLFEPRRPNVPMAMWQSVVFGRTEPPAFKLYLWSVTPSCCEQAMVRLGCGGEWPKLVDVLRPDDLVSAFSMDLSEAEDARVKLYVHHKGRVTAPELERAAGIARKTVSGDATSFLRIMSGCEDPSLSRPMMSCFSLKSRLIDSHTIIFPLFPNVLTDAEASERIEALFAYHDLPSDSYKRCVAAFSSRSLSEESHIHTFVGFKRTQGKPTITVYFNSRMFLARHGQMLQNWSFVRAWRSAPAETCQASG